MIKVFIVPAIIILAVAVMEIVFIGYQSNEARNNDRKLFYIVIFIILIIYCLILHFTSWPSLLNI